ncbi:MAG: hypothetical protein EBU90_08715 [Proteobacteria bacterium]|nr:hypothetical protein [Pseudomonadota bacterium]
MAVNPQKFLPSKETTKETINIKKSSIVLSQNSVKNIATIKVKVIQIESILKGTLALEKKALDQKKRKESAGRREKQEEKLETKTNMGMGGIKMPQRPKLGIFDWIKNFIGNVILGYFAVRLVDHLPKIMPIVKLLGKAGDLIVDFGGKLLNGLATFIDWGYKAVDFSRGLIGKTFGDDALKNFDKLTSEFEKFMNLAIIVGMASADFGMDRMRRPGPTGPTRGGTRTRTGGAPMEGPDIRNPLRRRPTITQGRGGTRLASKFGPKILKAVPFLGAGLAITEGIMRIREGDIVGGLLAFGTAIPGFGWGFLALDIAREFMGGQEFDKKVGRALSGKPGLTNKQVQKRTPHFFGPDPIVGAAGGGPTRGGKSKGAVKRTIGKTKKAKYKRVIPQKPGKVEITSPGADVGGEDKIFGIFPNPLKGAQKVIDAMNPFNTLKKSGEELGKTDYFGPILAITSKLLAGQKPSQQDYRNVGLGINMLIAKGIQDKQLKGGVVAAFAEGGMVDPDVLSAAETGGDISNWVAKTFQGEIESNAQRTLRLIKENAEKKKDEPSKEPPSPDIDLDGAGTTGGGTADTSLNPYRRAFLDTLAFAEGTANYPNTGYNTIFSGKQFSGYKDHPRRLITSGGYSSDAAGRYQFLSTTWDGLGLPDFSPANQDKGALKLLAPHVLAAIDKGDFATAFHGARKTWASLPGAGYGQPEKKMKTLVGYANNRLAKYQKGEIGKPITSIPDLGSAQPTGANGRLSPGQLTTVQGGYQLRSDAAQAFQNAAASARKSGVNISLSSAYRSYEKQAALYANRASNPYPVAAPGTSNHGYGIAIDVPEGTPGHNWMIANGRQFGWKNLPGDAVHFDFVGGSRMKSYHTGSDRINSKETIAKLLKKESVLDVDTSESLRKIDPQLIGKLNRATNVQGVMNVLQQYASYESGAEQTVVVIDSTPTTSMGGGYGDSGAVMMMGGSGGESDPFESLAIGG